MKEVEKKAIQFNRELKEIIERLGEERSNSFSYYYEAKLSSLEERFEELFELGLDSKSLNKINKNYKILQEKVDSYKKGVVLKEQLDEALHYKKRAKKLNITSIITSAAYIAMGAVIYGTFGTISLLGIATGYGLCTFSTRMGWTMERNSKFNQAEYKYFEHATEYRKINTKEFIDINEKDFTRSGLISMKTSIKQSLTEDIRLGQAAVEYEPNTESESTY